MHRRPLTRPLVAVAASATLVAIAAAGAASATGPTEPPPTTTEAPPVDTGGPGPATDPPATDPPATDPPATDPPATDPPDSTTAPAPTNTPALPAGSTTTTTDATEPEGPSLRILLTNDDGWDAEGITAVRAALIAAGHDVVVVAPATNQSGTGGRATFVGDLTLTQQAEGVFSLDGSPADATELGLDIAFGGELPDLVISGSNAGQNIGAVAVHSGTIGAAVTALNDGVPAIAVSTEENLSTGEGDFEGTAAFVVAMVEALVTEAGDGPVLPEGIGLNVNFPLVEDGGDPAGVTVAATDTGFLDVDYSAVSVPAVGEEATVTPGLALLEGVDPEADVARLADDFVTVTFIAGNYDVTPPAESGIVDELGPLLVDLGL